MIRRCVAMLTAFAVAFTSVPLPAAAEEPVEAASSASADLEPGTYVEHEAIAYVVGDAGSGAGLFSFGGDVLSGAEDLMDVDADTAAEALSDDGADAASARAASADEGRLVLVRDESKTTEELIAALEADERVVFAEPNLTVEVPEEDAEDADDLAAAVDLALDAELPESRGASGDAAAADGTAADEAVADDTPAGDAAADDGTPADDAPAAEGSDTFGEDKPDSAAADLTDYQWGFDNKADGDNGTVDMRSSEWDSRNADESLDKVIVAVIDSGVDASNPDLAPVMWDEGLTSGIEQTGGEDEYGFSTVTDGGASSTGQVTNFHGAHVAGIIGAAWDGKGVSGMASNVRIMSVRHNDTLDTLLQCLDYVSRARDAGVEVRVTNNSWGTGLQASRAIDLAVTELGEKGVTSIFASGNATTDGDAASTLVTTLADNPYVVVVDSIDPDGNPSDFSNTGETTSDVMAPGSAVVSTMLTGKSTGTPAAATQQYLGEADADAVLYESFDGKTRSNGDGTSFAQGAPVLGFQDGAGASLGEIQEGAVAPLGGIREGVGFDGTGAYVLPYDGSTALASAYTRPIDLSGTKAKPRYLSMHYSFANAALTDADGAPYGQVLVGVKLKEKTGYTWAQLPAPSFSAQEWLSASLDLGGAAVALGTDGRQDVVQLTADMIDWESFQLQIAYMVNEMRVTGGVPIVPSSDPLPCELVLDGIGLGSDLVPYAYEYGTSMACPAVAGAAAAIAGTGAADVAGDPAKSAEKLAALVRGAAQPDERYEGLCSTGGFATVDGAQNPGPAVTAVEDGGDTVAIQGYFMSQAAQVQLDGMDARVASCTDLGDGKVELTVTKPDSFAGGQVTVRVSEDGKESRQSADLGRAAGASYYEQMDLPVPEELTQWSYWQLVGFAGDLYCLPRGTAIGSTMTLDHMLRYDPSERTWTRVDLPTDEELAPVGLSRRTVYDVTATAYDGSLLVYLSAEDGANGFFRYTVDGSWEATGVSTDSPARAPQQGTLASDGESLYLFGGMISYAGAVTDNPSYIFRVDPATGAAVPVGLLSAPRICPQVSYRDGAFVVSGGAGIVGSVQGGGMAGADLVRWVSTDDGGLTMSATPLDFSTITDQTGQVAYASGATADGFLIAGAPNDAGTEDTYRLSTDDLSLTAYGKRASEQHLLIPSAVAYDGWFYVLAATQDAPYRAFSATAAETLDQPGDYVDPDTPDDPDNPDDPGDTGDTGGTGGTGDASGDGQDGGSDAGAGGLPQTGDPTAARVAAVAAAGVVALGAAAVASKERRRPSRR